MSPCVNSQQDQLAELAELSRKSSNDIMSMNIAASLIQIRGDQAGLGVATEIAQCHQGSQLANRIRKTAVHRSIEILRRPFCVSWIVVRPKGDRSQGGLQFSFLTTSSRHSDHIQPKYCRMVDACRTSGTISACTLCVDHNSGLQDEKKKETKPKRTERCDDIHQSIVLFLMHRKIKIVIVCQHN